MRSVYRRPNLDSKPVDAPIHHRFANRLDVMLVAPSGANPMLSGERRIKKASGRPPRRKATPDAKAARRQPQVSTPYARMGVMSVPPRAMEPLVNDMAKVRLRINQVLATAIVASIKPAWYESEITPIYTMS